MEAQKTLNCQSNAEKKERRWRHHSAQLQIILQNDSNQNGKVLAEKQTHRPVDQNQESRSKPMFIRANNF